VAAEVVGPVLDRTTPPVAVRELSVAIVTVPIAPLTTNLPKARSFTLSIAIGVITSAVELAVAESAAKLLDAPNAPSATTEASAAKRKDLLNKMDVFIKIPLKTYGRVMTASNCLVQYQSGRSKNRTEMADAVNLYAIEPCEVLAAPLFAGFAFFRIFKLTGICFFSK
jgi:hypothetical protein